MRRALMINDKYYQQVLELWGKKLELAGNKKPETQAKTLDECADEHPEWFCLDGAIEDPDLLAGNLREEGIKVLNLNEVLRKKGDHNMSAKSESIKRQKKQQRKALKRNRVHKIFRTQKNRWNDLGKDKQHISRERARHTGNLYRGLENVEQMIKRYSDKIKQETIDLFHQLKEDVLIAKKTKVKDILDKAIAAILPVAQEIEKIYKENEAPIADNVNSK